MRLDHLLSKENYLLFNFESFNSINKIKTLKILTIFDIHIKIYIVEKNMGV